MFKLFGEKCNIKFHCDPKCKGIIPEPYPAKKLMPDWYKKLESFTAKPSELKFRGSTLKRCPPFLDAMSVGWIIPLAADVKFIVQDDGAGVQWNTEFFFKMVDSHSIEQIKTHPNVPKVPLKILNHWIVETPPGWSCLFVPPLNRPDKHLDLMAGLVETDKYFEYINFPGFMKIPEGNIQLDAGYPLMQCIPFRRNIGKDAVIAALSEKNQLRLQRTRDKRTSNISLYRDHLWEKK